MKKSPEKENINLDKEEREILSSFERGKFNSIKDVKKEKTHAKKVAKITLLTYEP